MQRKVRFAGIEIAQKKRIDYAVIFLLNAWQLLEGLFSSAMKQTHNQTRHIL